jgi:hypothetical protein
LGWWSGLRGRAHPSKYENLSSNPNTSKKTKKPLQKILENDIIYNRTKDLIHFVNLENKQYHLVQKYTMHYKKQICEQLNSSHLVYLIMAILFHVSQKLFNFHMQNTKQWIFYVFKKSLHSRIFILNLKTFWRNEFPILKSWLKNAILNL